MSAANYTYNNYNYSQDFQKYPGHTRAAYTLDTSNKSPFPHNIPQHLTRDRCNTTTRPSAFTNINSHVHLHFPISCTIYAPRTIYPRVHIPINGYTP